MKILLALLCALFFACPGAASPRDYTRLVVFSDPHLPGRLLEQKSQVVRAVSKWRDVDGIAVTGDITETSGTAEEYAFAKAFLAQLKKPLYPIAGNHDFIYDLGPDEKLVKASVVVRRAKLKLFQDTFGLPATHYEKKFGRYLCLFISNDDLDSGLLTVMSSGTLAWLQTELRANPVSPTIIFFHGPLEGTVQGKNEVAGRPSFVAQPADKLRAILGQNPQVFMWVSGHVHMGATNAGFADPKANVYASRVTNIQNCDMDGRSYLSEDDHRTTTHDNIWTNSLFLYPDRVVVKTYDHQKKAWMKSLTRTIRPPVAAVMAPAPAR